MPVSLSLPTPGAITVMCGKTPPTWTRGGGVSPSRTSSESSGAVGTTRDAGRLYHSGEVHGVEP